ncbi:hypothetical protein HDU92_001376 [Lobulomyces angularis]|nr:hypothetical protein HDU92_001376 [Lobulomyces angularis]
MQDYPQFEVIFVVKDSNDDAIHVVKRLQRAYPNVDSSLIIGDCNDVGVNPKVNNLVQGYNKAKYDIIWIADSNVSVDEGCCGRSVDELCKDRVGLVHHLPIGIDATSFGSRLEMAFLNIVHAKMYVAINWLAPASCIIGKSNMFRKSDLADVGGLKYFGKYMSEDNFIALHLWNKGLKHRMTTDCAYQSLGSNNTKDFLNRRSRWGRVRKYAVPAATLIEPITESLVLGLCFSLALRHFFGFNVYLTLILHFLFWFTSDYLILKTFNPLEVNAIEFWLSWLFREITALPVYCFAISGSCVNWRGKTFHLLSDGTVTLKVEKS